MTIYSVYVLNRAGGLIYHYDHYTPKGEVEKTFSYPLEIVLKEDEKLVVAFGERDGIKGINPKHLHFFFYPFPAPEKKIFVGKRSLDTFVVFCLPFGHALMAINGESVTGRKLANGIDAMEVIQNPENYPISLKFGRPKLKTNERIMLASMFHP